MRLNVVACSARRVYAELDFARHMPKAYIERVKRTIPKKVYSNCFGAPELIRWTLRPEHSVVEKGRPWEQKELSKSLSREKEYESALLSPTVKRPAWMYRETIKMEQLPDEQWTIFPGDVVQIMVGRDKGKQGTVSRVIRDINGVYVQGMHCIEKGQSNIGLGIKGPSKWEEQPLDVTKNQVKLVDPNDNEPCEAKWILNAENNQYIRVSIRSGYEIPLPKRAYVTYDYVTIERYMDVADKDTNVNLALEQTYSPKLMSFEDEIMEEMGIEEKRRLQPTYWY